MKESSSRLAEAKTPSCPERNNYQQLFTFIPLPPPKKKIKKIKAGVTLKNAFLYDFLMTFSPQSGEQDSHELVEVNK